MGYKLAGYDVIGNCEIDDRMNELYKVNNHPRYNFKMDIREFKKIPKEELPEELFELDILDGSPPCSSFSIAGVRDKAWGKKKVFREGQTAQVLDDLFFEFIDVAEKLQPRAIVAENVRGLISGQAKGYVNEILKRLQATGYVTQMFLLNAAFMGIPQRRERVVFASYRKDCEFPKLKLEFNEAPIYYKDIKAGTGRPLASNSKLLWYWRQRIRTDDCAGDITERIYGKAKSFNSVLFHDNKVPNTLTANGTLIRYSEPCQLSNTDMIRMSTFPADYDFMKQNVQYVCGMSVPPVMMKKVAEQIASQWFLRGEECN